MDNKNCKSKKPSFEEDQYKKLLAFLRDLADQEYLPCGCWKSKRTGETMVFCYTHLMDDKDNG